MNWVMLVVHFICFLFYNSDFNKSCKFSFLLLTYDTALNYDSKLHIGSEHENQAVSVDLIRIQLITLSYV